VAPDDGHLGGYLNGFRPFDASGNDMIRVPKLTFNLGASYDINTAAGGFGLDMNWSYNDGFAWDADNRLKQPSYPLIDAGLKWTPPGAEDRYAIRLWAKNLGKEKYYVSETQSGGAIGNSALPGAPRTYGAELSVKF
jgi:iron complex outermembrane receptor protein